MRASKDLSGDPSVPAVPALVPAGAVESHDSSPRTAPAAVECSPPEPELPPEEPAERDYRAMPYREFARLCGCELTPGQDAITRVVYDREPIDPANDLQVQIFGGCFPIADFAFAVFLAVCGARGGKSLTLLAIRILHLGLTVDLSHLAPGELAFGLIVAPDLRLSRQTLRFVAGAIGALGIECQVLADSISFERDGHKCTIECLPATRGGGAVRGRSLFGAALDEACFFRSEDGNAINDSEIYKAIAPRILPDGQFLIGSTPMFEEGLVHELFVSNYGHPETCVVVHAPTLVLRPDDEHIGAMVRRLYAVDPENADREYGANFVGADSGNFFDPVLLGAAVGAVETKKEKVSGAVDLGETTHVPAALAVERQGGKVVVTMLTIERAKSGQIPKSPRECMALFAREFTDRRCVHVAVAAEHFEATEEKLRRGDGDDDAPPAVPSPVRLIVGLAHGHKAKALVYVRDLLRSRRLVLPLDPRLLVQMRGVKSKESSTGGLEIFLPKNTSGRASLIALLAQAIWLDRRHGEVTDAPHVPKVFAGIGRAPLGGLTVRSAGERPRSLPYPKENL